VAFFVSAFFKLSLSRSDNRPASAGFFSSVKTNGGNTMSFVTVKQLSVTHPAFSENSIRFHIHHAKPRIDRNGNSIPANGLADAISRIGRKVLIDQDKFIVWLVERGGKA
jgi:hypothetical protein